MLYGAQIVYIDVTMYLNSIRKLLTISKLTCYLDPISEIKLINTNRSHNSIFITHNIISVYI